MCGFAGELRFDHRPADLGEQPTVDSELGLSLVFNGCIYNYRELRSGATAARLSLLLELRHRSELEGVPPLASTDHRASQGLLPGPGIRHLEHTVTWLAARLCAR